ncbi:serine hydrolase domain-containing protein [Spirillospora sp. CA-294931]|uniref:serine hydrolase domain-containing protein n=1 Tax=Spirillospora sp. CA-294931 TaxID=3240042 RepID=UPI003D8E711F
MTIYARFLRRPMRRRLIPVVVALVGVAVPSVAFALDAPTTLQRDVDLVRATGASGVLAEVSASRGAQTARAGVADPAGSRPVPWNARHRIGSTTKTFVATVVLQLVGEGKIGLDDTVERWLPGVVNGNGNDGRKVTVRHLLGHTSGLPDYEDAPLEGAATPEEFRRERFRTFRPEQLVATAMRHRPLFKPGKEWAYANVNYVLAGMIIERATGAPWAQAVHERVIEPLGLADTLIPGTSAYLPSPRLAAYKRLRPGGPLVDVSTFAAGHADASMISTTGDVNRFFRALLGGRLLKPAQLREMQKTRLAKPFAAIWDKPGYGLGLMKRRLPCGEWVWFHGGGWWNAITDNGVSSDGRRAVTVAIASTQEPGQDMTPQAKASAALIDHALCGTR